MFPCCDITTETAVKNEDDSDKKLREEVAIKEVSLIADEGDKTVKSAQLVEKNGNKSKETDTESALDIANQVSNYPVCTCAAGVE